MKEGELESGVTVLLAFKALSAEHAGIQYPVYPMKKQGEHFSSNTILDMKKNGWARFVVDDLKRGKINIWYRPLNT